MSILGKIKSWWVAKREAQRAWWLAPVKTDYESFNAEVRTLQLIVSSWFKETDATLKYRFSALDSRSNALEKQIAEVGNANSQQYASLDTRLYNSHVAISARLEKIEAELNGIRSRYKWMEDRYDDAAKGNLPRTFDYDKRQ